RNRRGEPAIVSYSRRLISRSHEKSSSPTSGEGTTMTGELAARRRTVRGNFLLTMSNSPSRSRDAFLRPGFATLLHSPRVEGWAERRQAHLIVVVAPVRARVSRACEARRVRCARRATHARLSALHRGFPLPLIPERKEAYATPRSAFRMSPET